jgi:hypothetical protein
MKQTIFSLACILSFGLMALAQIPETNPPKPPPKKAVVTAAQVNGVYSNRGSDFRILALGHGKLKVQFNGQYMTLSGVPNLGEAMGEATIDGNIATFIPGDTQGCEITLVFLPNKLKVMQSGSDAECGFGHNVFATGTYKRIKAGKPKFIDWP